MSVHYEWGADINDEHGDTVDVVTGDRIEDVLGQGDVFLFYEAFDSEGMLRSNGYSYLSDGLLEFDDERCSPVPKRYRRQAKEHIS